MGRNYLIHINETFKNHKVVIRICPPGYTPLVVTLEARGLDSH